MPLLLLLLQATEPERRILFASDKIYTVLGVVLLVWVGILAFLLRTNQRINRLEKKAGVSEKPQPARK